MAYDETSYELRTAQDELVANQTEGALTADKNRLKLISATLSFFLTGLNDGSIGALLPYVLHEYDIDTDRVAVL